MTREVLCAMVTICIKPIIKSLVSDSQNYLRTFCFSLLALTSICLQSFEVSCYTREKNILNSFVNPGPIDFGKTKKGIRISKLLSPTNSFCQSSCTEIPNALKSTKMVCN